MATFFTGNAADAGNELFVLNGSGGQDLIDINMGTGSSNPTLLTYFKSGAGVAADNASHGQFLYDTVSHDLSWDADGSGGGAASLIAHFDNNYIVKIADLMLIA